VLNCSKKIHKRKQKTAKSLCFPNEVRFFCTPHRHIESRNALSISVFFAREIKYMGAIAVSTLHFLRNGTTIYRYLYLSREATAFGSKTYRIFISQKWIFKKVYNSIFL